MENVNFKVGDKVFIRTRWNMKIETIVKETKTRFYTRHYTFHKKNSTIVGHRGYKVVKPTQEHFDMIEKNIIARHLNNFDFDKVSLDVLRKIHEVLKLDKKA